MHRIIMGAWGEKEHPVSPVEAVAIARHAAREHGLRWEEPPEITETFTAWVVWSNSWEKGNNVKVVVGKKRGEVRKVSREGPFTD